MPGISHAHDYCSRGIGMITVENEAADVLVVSENGFGKRSAISDYRLTNRGGKGVKTINITDKTGKLIALKDVSDQYDLLIITQNGNILRTPVNELRVMGRATQGVKLIDIKENDSIASVAYVEVNEDDNEPGIDIEEQSADSAE